MPGTKTKRRRHGSVAKRTRKLERQRERRLRMLRRGLLVAAIALMTGAGAALGIFADGGLGRSHDFRLTRLRVAGVDAETALAWLAGSGVKPGDPLLGIDLPELRTLLRRNPEVQDVVLRRRPSCG